MHWFMGGLNSFVEPPLIPLNLPGAIKLDFLSGGQTLENMFAAGELDALFSLYIPNLLFWEGHVDLGGPIKKDKVWFYGAYNHFKIDKAVSGIAQSVATDLGIFDNYTAKVTAKPGQSNTFIGYIQQGRKQKPKRGLSTLIPPESVRAQDSMSRMYKGEWQRVVSNRTFFNVNVGNFTLDWPMAVQVGRFGSSP